MKKTLALVLAGLMTAGMTTVAFAADPSFAAGILPTVALSCI